MPLFLQLSSCWYLHSFTSPIFLSLITRFLLLLYIPRSAIILLSLPLTTKLRRQNSLNLLLISSNISFLNHLQSVFCLYHSKIIPLECTFDFPSPVTYSLPLFYTHIYLYRFEPFIFAGTEGLFFIFIGVTLLQLLMTSILNYIIMLLIDPYLPQIIYFISPNELVLLKDSSNFNSFNLFYFILEAQA